MASELDIWNMAIGRLKIGQFVRDPDDTSTVAGVCSRFYDQCRREVLQAYPWGCASKAEALVEVDSQTFPGWQYVYQYPTGCLRVWCIADSGGMRSVYSTVFNTDPRDLTQTLSRYTQPWRIAMKDDQASKVILSDTPDAWAFSTFDLETTGVFESDLSSVIAWRLAMEIGGPLQAAQDMVDRAEQRYAIWLSQTAARNFNEMKDDPQQDSPSISARY